MRAVELWFMAARRRWKSSIFPKVHAGPGQVRVRNIRGGGEPHGHDGTERLTRRAAEGGPTALRAGHGRGWDCRRGRCRCLHRCAGGDAVMAMVVPKGSHGPTANRSS